MMRALLPSAYKAVQRARDKCKGQTKIRKYFKRIKELRQKNRGEEQEVSCEEELTGKKRWTEICKQNYFKVKQIV